MEWLTKMFNRKTSSGTVAKDRLKLVLIHDRANCSTDLLEMMKNDIMQVIAKYMDIDEAAGMDINISQTVTDHNETVPVLYANIPIKNMRKRGGEADSDKTPVGAGGGNSGKHNKKRR